MCEESCQEHFCKSFFISPAGSHGSYRSLLFKSERNSSESSLNTAEEPSICPTVKDVNKSSAPTNQTYQQHSHNNKLSKRSSLDVSGHTWTGSSSRPFISGRDAVCSSLLWGCSISVTMSSLIPCSCTSESLILSLWFEVNKPLPFFCKASWAMP